MREIPPAWWRRTRRRWHDRTKSYELAQVDIRRRRHRRPRVLKRRREWFAPVKEMMTALWWVPSGHRPAIAEAEAKIRLLRAQGPSPDVFTLRKHFPAPGPTVAQATEGDPGWLCPA